MAVAGERGTRERILAVAEDFLGDQGYHGTRLHRIAERVGIQKASLFHYFSSKEELYHSVLHEGFGESEQTIRRVLEAEGTPMEKVGGLVGAYVDMVAAHPKRTKILLRQSLGDAPSGYPHGADPQRLLALVATFIADGQRTHVFAPIDPLGLVLSVVGMVAFFFTSAPVLAPTWCGDPRSPAGINHVKLHVIEVVRRCLAVEEQSCASTARVAAR